MPKASPIRSSFNAGELSPLLDGRVDVAKYQNGCKTLENFIPSVQGPAVRRPGTRFVAEVKSSAARTWLQRFEFSATQAYVLEFGNGYIRFYTNHGQLLLSSTPTAWSSSTAYKIGNLVRSGGVNYYAKQDHTNRTPASNPSYWHAMTGNIYEVPTPYTTADLIDTSSSTFKLSIAQSADVLYIAHPNYPLKKLARYSATRWVFDDVDLIEGPFDDMNTNRSKRVWCSAVSGNSVQINANFDAFSADDVGALFYIEPDDYATIKPWTAGQEYSTNPNGILRRSDGKIYKCVTNAAPTAGKKYRTGPNKPVHTWGAEPDGDYNGLDGTNIERQGIDWQFLSPTKGWLQIHTFVNDQQVLARVMGGNQLPRNVVPSGATTTIALATPNGAVNSGGTIRIQTATAHGLSAGNVVSSVTFYYYKTRVTGGYQIANVSSTKNVTVTSVVNSTTFDTDIDTPEGFVESATITAILTLTGFIQTSVGSVNTAETYRWAKGAFSDVNGYPEKVTFFRERLVLAKGQKLFFSVAGDFENFAATDISSNVVADRAIRVSINTEQVNSIQWMAPTQALLIGTVGAEFACAENSAAEAFAPANVKIEQTSSEGSRAVNPVRVGYSVLFAQKSGRKLKELAYSFQQNGFVPSDLSLLSEHLTYSGITQMGWHKEPYVCAWAVRGDGQLLGFTFNREQDVVGWHRHRLGGSGIVESIAVIPHPDGDKDELWLIVRRTINGATKRYIEYLETGYDTGMAQEDAFYVDCGLTYSGAATTTITGLGHLEGQTVQLLVNGAAHPDRVVTGGSITLQVAATKVQGGLGYTSTLQTNRIDAAAADGTAQGKTKRINKVVTRFLNTLGAWVGPTTSSMDEVQFRFGSAPMDSPPPLFSGDKLIEFRGDYDFDGYMTIQQRQPLPMTVVAIMPQLHTFDR